MTRERKYNHSISYATTCQHFNDLVTWLSYIQVCEWVSVEVSVANSEKGLLNYFTLVIY